MNTTTQKIYIDLDDVLCDTAGAYLQLIALEFNKKISFEEIHSFNLQKSFQLSDEENRHMFRCAHMPDFVMALQPFENIISTLSQWKSMGKHIAIVTGRHTSAHKESLEWLEKHAIPFDSFTMVDKYGWQDTDSNIAISLEKLTTMAFDFAIEDNPEMVQHLHCTMATPVFVYDRPWNRALEMNAALTRCRNWQEIADAIPPITW